MSTSIEERQTKETDPRDGRILSQFQEIMSSVQEELNKGKVPHVTVSEPRLNNLTRMGEVQKYIENKEKYRDRLAGDKGKSLADGWESVFRS